MSEMIRDTIDSLPPYFGFQTSAEDILPHEEALEDAHRIAS
jgi:hypothetical protein